MGADSCPCVGPEPDPRIAILLLSTPLILPSFILYCNLAVTDSMYLFQGCCGVLWDWGGNGRRERTGRGRRQQGAVQHCSSCSPPAAKQPVQCTLLAAQPIPLPVSIILEPQTHTATSPDEAPSPRSSHNRRLDRLHLYNLSTVAHRAISIDLTGEQRSCSVETQQIGRRLLSQPLSSRKVRVTAAELVIWGMSGVWEWGTRAEG